MKGKIEKRRREKVQRRGPPLVYFWEPWNGH